MASMCWIVILVVVCVLGCVDCQMVTLGSCPDVQVQENFDLNRYLGKWYENRRYTNWFSLFSNCVTAEYTKISDTSVKVNNTGWLYLTNEVSTAIGEAKIKDGAKLGVKFSEFAPFANYWVLLTDYENYSIVYSCSDSPKAALGFKSQLVWILTRTTDELKEAELQKITPVIQKYGINMDERKLKRTSHKNCFVKMDK